jgi:tetratricopeptide (TPR) repeat protein
LRDGRIEDARNSFYKAVMLVPDNYVLWNEVLFLNAELAHYDSLYNHAKQAVGYFPAQAGFHYFAGLGAYHKKKYDEAIESFLQARKMLALPDQKDLDAEVLQFLGDAYHANKQYDLAFEAYEKHLTYRPENAYVLNNYAYYLSLQKKDLDKAAKMALKANKLRPDQPSYMDTYGWVLFQQGEYQDAEFWIKKAIDKTTSSATILEHYGDVLFKTGKKEEAMVFWKKAQAQLKTPSPLLEEKIKTGEWKE